MAEDEEEDPKRRIGKMIGGFRYTQYVYLLAKLDVASLISDI
jgi:hypothetical protein